MSKTLFRFYTDNNNLVKWLKSLNNQTEAVESVLKKFVDGELVPLQELEEKQQLQLDYLRKRNHSLDKRNLKLDLDNWNALKSLGYAQKEAIALITGKVTLQQPSLDMVPTPDDGLCDLCGHKHTTTGPRVCTTVSCNCGVR